MRYAGCAARCELPACTALFLHQLSVCSCPPQSWDEGIELPAWAEKFSERTAEFGVKAADGIVTASEQAQSKLTALGRAALSKAGALGSQAKTKTQATLAAAATTSGGYLQQAGQKLQTTPGGRDQPATRPPEMP